MQRPLACLLLAALAVALYWPVGAHEFIQFDTPDYVLENPAVLAGLTAESVTWAFTEFHAANWHPLTWLSHMLDVELFGLDPGAHHRTNVWLHALAAVLLFLTLERATGSARPSLFVAAVFAAHPLHVESVAWVAERKDVLSTALGFGALYAWVLHVERPGAMRYATALACFALGLLAKPMLVTLPLVMLLLDVWPLDRAGASARARVTEKLPFFALAAASCLVTLAAQSAGGAVKTLEHFSLASRVQNAAVAYVTYLGKSVWPTDLAVWYPHRTYEPLAWAGALALLAALTAAALAVRRRAPYALVGWLWFLATLVPVIGLVQVGAQSHADRYTYLPQTGLVLAATWSAAAWIRRPPAAPVVLGSAVVAVLSVVTWNQLALWRTTESLFQHTVRVTDRNYVAHNVLGGLQVDEGRLAAGIAHFRTSLRYMPTYHEANNNLGRALIERGELEEARRHFEWCVEHLPDNWEAYNQLGIVYGRLGRSSDAERLFRRTLEQVPDDPKVHYNLGLELDRSGRYAEALEEFRAAATLDPDYANAHAQVGIQSIKLGRNADALPALTEALRHDPQNAEAHYWLGGVHAMARRDADAVRHYERAFALLPEWSRLLTDFAFVLATSHDDAVRDPARAVRLAEGLRALTDGAEPNALDTLAAAYAAAGRYEDAATTARRALDLARAAGRESLARKIEPRIELYESGRAYRASPP